MTSLHTATFLVAGVLALAGLNDATAQTDEFGAPVAKPTPAAVVVPAAGTIPEDQIPVANKDKVICRTFLGAQVTARQQAAFLYLLKNTDEETFVRGVNYGTKTDSEFSSNTGSEADQNAAALAWAHNVMNGVQDIPVILTINLFRYNLDNKSFITDATSHNLNLNLGYRGVNLGPIENGNLSGVLIHHWDQFSSIVMSPEDAKSISAALAPTGERQILVFGHIRLRRESKKLLKDRNETQFDADFRDYKLGFADDVLCEKYVDKMVAGRYVRTAVEIAFGQQADHKAYLSPNEVLMFLKDGSVYTGVSNNTQIRDKVQALANASVGLWYITNGSLFFSIPTYNRRNNYLKSFAIEGDTLRLNGIPYVLDPHLQLNGTDITYR